MPEKEFLLSDGFYFLNKISKSYSMKMFCLIFAFLILFSCKPNTTNSSVKSSTTNINESINHTEVIRTEEKTGSVIDTLKYKEKNYFLTQIPKSYYENAIDKSIKLFIETIDTNKIIINSDSISVFALDTTLTFKNKEGEENKAVYSFNGLILQTQFVHISGSFWEWSEDYLIGINSGQIISLWGTPAISPDKSKIIAYNSDLVAMMGINGIQLFRYSNDSIWSDFKLELNNWGPEEVKWEDESTLLIKRLMLDEDFQPRFDYVKIIL